MTLALNFTLKSKKFSTCIGVNHWQFIFGAEQQFVCLYYCSICAELLECHLSSLMLQISLNQNLIDVYWNNLNNKIKILLYADFRIFGRLIRYVVLNNWHLPNFC